MKVHVEITRVKHVAYPTDWSAPSLIEGIADGVTVQIRGDDFPSALSLGGLLAGASDNPIEWKDE